MGSDALAPITHFPSKHSSFPKENDFDCMFLPFSVPIQHLRKHKAECDAGLLCGSELHSAV